MLSCHWQELCSRQLFDVYCNKQSNGGKNRQTYFLRPLRLTTIAHFSTQCSKLVPQPFGHPKPGVTIVFVLLPFSHSLYTAPVRRASSTDMQPPISTPTSVFSSIIEEQPNFRNIGSTMTGDVSDSETANSRVVDQDDIKTEDDDVVTEKKQALEGEETSTLADLCRATETIKDLLALIHRQA